MSVVLEALKGISQISFSCLSPSEIRRYSVAEISVPETYDEDGQPIRGGLMDPRLGTIEPGQRCETCGNTSARCPGHFGHIELAAPVIHIAFVDEIYRILASTCRACGRLLLPQAELDYYRSQLSERAMRAPGATEALAKEIVAKARKVKNCPHCGKPQGEIELQKPYTFYEKMEDGGSLRLPNSVIRDRLERVSDEDLILLNYNPKASRPEWWVLQVLPVPPVTVRPSITLETGIRSEDDLTHKLVDILRTNARIEEAKRAGTPPLIMQDLVDLLQYHVATYFDNELTGIPQAHHRSGRPLKTLSQRLKGKEGRFRGSLSGKRVDFSSRTVISPDPNLDISEVGVPLEVAKKLTVPEPVTPWNIERLRRLVENGPHNHPGANYVIRSDGVKIRLDFVSDRKAVADSLAPGYVVERHLMDGDIAIFNRQPSLHRMSIMAHYVRVLPYRTFRLHPAVCPPYNADFDGDEMNLHIPQSVEARGEAETLMKVHEQIISPRYGGPIIGAIRDFLTAAYLLTREETYLTKEEFANLAAAGGYDGPLPEPVVAEPVPLYSGKQLFSLFLPKGFNYILTSKWGRGLLGGDRKDVVVRDGQLVSGVIDRASIGAEEPDSILHRICKDYGPEEARRFLNSILRVLKAVITRFGFSYGYEDLQLDPETKEEIQRTIRESYERVQELVRQYEAGTLPLKKGLSPEEALEQYILNELTEARNRAGRLAERRMSYENPGVIMARTGARGSLLNLSQMAASLGQQTVRGQRITKGYRGRALPHFLPGDNSPDAKGFIKSCYRDGLTPIEFFFHAMAGREGLIDTAVRTQQSGYMQRRLINAMEHLKVEYDMTVRDPYGNIIQFVYGEDGVDPAKSDHGRAVNVTRLAETIKLTDRGEPASRRTIEAVLRKYRDRFNERVLGEIRAALERIPLSPRGVRELCERAYTQIERARVEPGESSGVVAAQSIGEPGTQMTLRTFHFAGVREMNVTLGLPRLIELIDARKTPSTPTMTIYLEEEYRRDEQAALTIAREVLFTKLSDVVESHETDYSTGSIIFHLNPKAMEERGVSVEDVVDVLKPAKRPVEVGDGWVRVVSPAMDPTSLYALRERLLNTRVKGIPGISRVNVVKVGDEWVIETAGSNLPRVLRVPGVDPTRTRTNNIFEIFSTLGIEAAREALVREIMSTLEEQGLEVDLRHILLVADLMTAKGVLQQVGRHGVVGTKASVLARAAFEITVPTLAEAAMKGQVEELRGVTENVIVGHPIPVGTGMVNLFMELR
jgi:DNA-directed RNA polymerase subunit A'